MLHSFKPSVVQRVFESEAPQQPRPAKKARVGGGGCIPAPKTGENVTALGFHVRPMGAAPSNDQGTKLVWAYKRGIWVDASGDGTWNGVRAADGEREAVAAEADLERRLAALGTFTSYSVTPSRSGEEELTSMLAEPRADEPRAEPLLRADGMFECESLQRAFETIAE